MINSLIFSLSVKAGSLVSTNLSSVKRLAVGNALCNSLLGLYVIYSSLWARLKTLSISLIKRWIVSSLEVRGLLGLKIAFKTAKISEYFIVFISLLPKLGKI